jgi:hypothetical protein
VLWNKVTPKDRAEHDHLAKFESVLEIPDSVVYLSSVSSILFVEMGFGRSIDKQASQLGDGTAIPMISYGLIEYLMAMDLSGMDVLEIGGGGSTEFWASRSKSVLTFETDPGLAQTLRGRQFSNVTVQTSTPDTLARDLGAVAKTFDIIVIDPAANRYACAKAVRGMLRPGGFMLLDNSDWYPNTAKFLRDGDLIQVDFPDFRPLHHFRAVASLFLHRDFRPKPKFDRMPVPCLGGKDSASINVWDQMV